MERIIDEVKLNNGLNISGYRGEYIFTILQQTRETYEADLLEHWEPYYQKEAKVIFDIGANLGNHTLYFAKNAKARIYSFEPVESNYQLLVRNVKQNGFEDQVTTFQTALGEHTQTAWMTFNVENNDGTASIKEGIQEGIQVQIRAGDEMDLPAPDFIKMDVEGYELHVLRGMEQILSQSKPAIWIELDETTREETLDYLYSLGYLPTDFQLMKNNNILFQKLPGREYNKALILQLMDYGNLARNLAIQNWLLRQR